MTVVSRRICNSHMATRHFWVLVVVLVGHALSSSIRGVNAGGIPGTSQTDSGYDTEAGVDAICWKSNSGGSEGIALPNPLIADFVVDFQGVELLRACPIGNNVSGTQPDENTIYGEQLRTMQDYNYTVTLNVNMSSLRASQGFTSDQGPGFIAIQILSCVAGLSGFCSPFVHEQAIERERKAIEAAKAANPNFVPTATKRARGDMHGGTHIHSVYMKLDLPVDDGPVFKNIPLSIPQRVNAPGEYYTIVAVQLYFWEDTEPGQEPRLVRYDMANKLVGQQSLTYYAKPPDILEVDVEVEYASYALIIAACSIQLFMLVQAIKHRNSQVMNLSQGQFMVVFLITATTATGCSFLMNPRNDFYCRASIPLVMISLHTFYAVTVGRLWRIHTLISPLLLKSLTSDSAFGKFVDKQIMERFFWGCRRGNQAIRIRQQVTEAQLHGLVVLLVIPQVIIQLLALLLQPPFRDVDFNSDKSTGRHVCETDNANGFAGTLTNWGFIYFAVLVLGLLKMAFKSRKLPSLFNESKTIFDSTMTTVLIIVMGVSIIIVTEGPTNSPSVNYLVTVFVILSITVNTSIRIVWPKLRMIWRGENVIVSQLVLDHARESRRSEVESVGGDSRVPAAILYDERALHPSSTPTPKQNSTDIDLPAPISNLESTSQILQSEEVEDGTMKTDRFVSEETSQLVIDDKAEKSPKATKQVGFLGVAAEKYEAKNDNKPFKNKKIVVDPSEAPSRRLLLKMVDLHEHLGKVTQSLMSGIAVEEADWEQTRSLTGRVGRIFTDSVVFTWETEANASEQNDHFASGEYVDDEKEDS